MRVPTDLLEVYAPRTEWKFSLQTEDYKEAQSKILLKAQQLEQEFSEHRRKLKAKPRPLQTSPAITKPEPEQSPALTPFAQVSALELDRLALLYPHEALRKDEAKRRAPLRKDVKQAKAAWDEQQAFMVELNAARGLSYTPKPFRRLSGISEEEGRQLERNAELFVTQQPMALPDRGGLFVFCVSQWPLSLGVTGVKGGSSRPVAADYQ